MPTYKYSKAKMERIIKKETGSYDDQKILISDEDSLDFIEMSTSNFTPSRAKKLWKKEGWDSEAENFELVIIEDEEEIFTEIFFE